MSRAQSAVGYLRVSTREQGRSGLGLAAQRREIEAFAAREGFSIRSWYQDVHTGAGKDALLLRPGLATALTVAQGARCPLVVARLDRLSRNVHFIAGLMEHQVHFVVARLGRDCDEFTLHIYASLAQQERKLMSERARAAAQVARSRGRKFGFELRSKAWRQHLSVLGNAVLVQEALDRAQRYRVHLEWALRQPGLDGGPISFRAAAEKLNERGLESPTGHRWRGHQIQRMVRRLELPHPPGYLKNEVVRARVEALWRERPDCTAAQVVARAGLEHPLGRKRAGVVLKAVRRAAAKGNSVQDTVGWRVDRWTSLRIRIGRILKRHPEFTGRQVIEKLNTGNVNPAEPPVRLKWVWQVMGEYHWACRRPSQQAQRKGRRFFPLWRPRDRRRKAHPSIPARRTSR